MAYKRELIINNGSLTSYKKLLKVSDVYQLLNKREYADTITNNGVTFTNNGDGSFTANGTATARVVFVFKTGLTLPNGIFLLSGKNGLLSLATDIYIDGVYTNTRFADSIFVSNYSGDFNGNLYFVVEAGGTVNNLTSKPQLFDLTEMYGAGNEPATVAEFKAKFPNELYPYSPRCWVTSYKTGLIAKTKNLFDISKVDTTTTLNVIDNTISAKNTSSDPLAWTYNNSQYKTTLDTGRYFISFDNMSTASSVDESTRLLVRDDTNAWVAQITDKAFVNNKVVTSFTLDKQTNIGIQLKLYTQVISNFQIEKGTTATDYVPYGYL